MIMLKTIRSPFDKAQGERKRHHTVNTFPFMLSMSKHEDSIFIRRAP
jgi:hypothetical protein